MRLIDKIRLEVRAGRGGDGILAYTAHKLKRLIGPGMPCGGNGGRGGDGRGDGCIGGDGGGCMDNENKEVHSRVNGWVQISLFLIK